MDSTNRLLAPALRKAEAEEINHKSQNFVISNFNYESRAELKQAFVKQSVDLKVEDIGFIWKIDDKGKVQKILVHLNFIVFRKEMSSTIKDSFLENTNKYSWILISLIFKDKKFEMSYPN